MTSVETRGTTELPEPISKQLISCYSKLKRKDPGTYSPQPTHLPDQILQIAPVISCSNPIINKLTETVL